MAKATANFVGFVDGLQQAVQEGAELPDSDPIVKANPDMFGKAKKPAAPRSSCFPTMPSRRSRQDRSG